MPKSITYTAQSINDNLVLDIGRRASNYFDGRIGLVQVWSDLAKTSLEFEYTWAASDGTDTSGNGRNLTLYGAPTFDTELTP